MTRSIHLVDIENLAGDAYDAHGIAQDRMRSCLRASRWVPGDFVTIASNSWMWRRVAWDVGVPHRYIVTRGGPDSADLALLHSAAELSLRTFDRVVIGSGDHIFAGIASNATKCGARVAVVANYGSIARSLRQYAHAVRELPAVPRYAYATTSLAA